jgi:ankyrin repeat protein
MNDRKKTAFFFQLLLGLLAFPLFGVSSEALFEAAISGDVASVETLLQEGASPSIKDGFQNTPLHLAASRGHRGVVVLLLNWGADRNATNTFGVTPLLSAAANRHYGIIDLFREHVGP